MNALWSDILAQGNNIQTILQHLTGAEKCRLEAAANFIKPEKPTFIIGIASAAYLCWPSQVLLSQGGYPSRIMNAADALYYEKEALKNANVVINSRSGETAEIVKLAEWLNSESIPFLAVTNEPESTLAHLADQILWANTRKDDLVSINVVTGMMLTMLVWAIAVRRELDQIQYKLESLPEAVTLTVQRTVEMADQLAEFLSGYSPIYLLARGGSQGASLCGRLVLEEVARQSSISLEAAEFRQGPNEVIGKQFCAVLFMGGGETVRLTRALGREIHKLGGHVISVGSKEAVRDLPGMIFPLPDVFEPFSPLCEVIPIQGLAYKLAEKRGITPGHVQYISKIIKDEASD